MSFENLGLAPALLRALVEQDYTEPTPIQMQAIPVALAGHDLLAGAQTGTGKTAAFALPLLDHLYVSKRGQAQPKTPRALVLTPTRELAAQVHDSVRVYGKHVGARATTIFGGVGMQPQVDALRRGVEIVVATPGRLMDHMERRSVNLSNIEILILDEADMAKKKSNFENRAVVDISSDAKWHDKGDPEMKCYLPGVPRANYMPFPFRIVQGSETPKEPYYLLFSYEYASANRIVRMNWKQEAPTPSWMGWNRGHWEGDTLVIDVTGLRDESWLDRVGDYHSEDLHVVERYTLASPYHMMYEATLEDPNVFTRPWKISYPLYRRMEKEFQLLEFKCVPFSEELLYGKYVKRAAK